MQTDDTEGCVRQSLHLKGQGRALGDRDRSHSVMAKGQRAGERYGRGQPSEPVCRQPRSEITERKSHGLKKRDPGGRGTEGGPTNPGHNAWRGKPGTKRGPGNKGHFSMSSNLVVTTEGLFAAPLGVKAPERRPPRCWSTAPSATAISWLPRVKEARRLGKWPR